MGRSRKLGLHLAKTIGAAFCLLLLAACSGGGGGGSSEVGAVSHTSSPPSSPPPSTAMSTVTLAWAPAAGPVAGYRIFVARDTGPFQAESDVAQPSVSLSGEPGGYARIQVAAFDAYGTLGPASPPSSPFGFPALESGSTALNSGAASAAAASAPTGGSVSRVASDDADAPTKAPRSVEAADLAGGLVWQLDGLLRVTDASLETQLVFARPTDDAVLSAVGDFDGDGLGDLLWSTPSGQLSYTPLASLARDASTTPVVEIGQLAAGERVVGAGDFDGDGQGDLLVVGASDAVDVWLSISGSAGEIARVGIAGGATLAGVADFDASGTDDVAWRGADGALVFWLMDRGQAAASLEIPLGNDWTVLSAGDFDGDVAAEIALRDANGAVSILYPLAAPVAFAATDLAETLAWTVAGSSDLDRDGSDDLVLANGEALRMAYLPGENSLPLDPSSPWGLVALLL